jgi:hypothetical protein
MYRDLLGLVEQDAIKQLQQFNMPYSIVYAEDKKTTGEDKIVIAVRSVDKKIVLVVGRFKTDVTKE